LEPLIPVASLDESPHRQAKTDALAFPETELIAQPGKPGILGEPIPDLTWISGWFFG